MNKLFSHNQTKQQTASKLIETEQNTSYLRNLKHKQKKKPNQPDTPTSPTRPQTNMLDHMIAAENYKHDTVTQYIATSRLRLNHVVIILTPGVTLTTRQQLKAICFVALNDLEALATENSDWLARITCGDNLETTRVHDLRNRADLLMCDITEILNVIRGR